MANSNFGDQSGDGSINVGVGDFRGAYVSIAATEPTFTLEQLEVQRHSGPPGRRLKTEQLNTFGIVTGIASVVGLYFTLFQAFPQTKASSWSTLFMFFFALAAMMLVTSFALQRRRFEAFYFGKFLECGSKGGLYLSSFTARCPWCGSAMTLRSVGPKDGAKDNMFICERNPRQHTVILDATILPDIDE